MEKFEFFVEENHAKLRLDKFLVENFKDIKPEFSRAKIQKIIEAKQVFNELDESLIDPSYKVKEGERISIEYEISLENLNLKPKKIDLEIIFEDQDLMVINKPAGLTVHPGAGNYDDTLVNGLLYLYGENGLSQIAGNYRAGIVHRLDKDTSGLMVVAKNDSAHQFLSDQLQQRKIDRKYLAFIFGALEPENGKIDKNITRNRTNRLKMAVSSRSCNSKSGSKVRNAITNYKTLKVFCKNNFASLVECKLETGRTHQIRVHMESEKHSLIGDQLYSSCKKNPPPELEEGAKQLIMNFSRQALHSYKIAFTHPKNKEKLEFEIDLPDDMKKLHETLRKIG